MGLTYDGITYRSLEEQVRYNAEQVQLLKQQKSNATNLENGTADVLIQTTDTNHSFKVMKDGRAKVLSAPVDNDDVVRKDDLKKTINIYKFSNTVYVINFGKFKTTLMKNVDTSRNQDNWNLVRLFNDDVNLVATASDMLGPIYESGQSDFVGGVHGHEHTTELKILIDDNEWDYTTSFNPEIVDIYLKSEIYRHSENTHIFNRFLHITITYNKIVVESTYKSVVDNITIYRCTNGGMLEIANTYVNSIFMNNIGLITTPTSQINNSSKSNTNAVFNTSYGKIKINNLKGFELDTYRGYDYVFSTSNKIYFNTIQGNTILNIDDEISGKFEYIIE